MEPLQPPRHPVILQELNIQVFAKPMTNILDAIDYLCATIDAVPFQSFHLHNKN